MTHYRSLNHSKWACQYHVVFIPKYRKKAIYGELRQYLGEVLRRLARQRESEVEEGHLLVDHVHSWSTMSTAGRPCPQDVVDSAEVLGGAGDRVHQGEERDPHRPGVRRAVAQLCRAALLGSRLLRVHAGSGRAGDSRMYLGAGTGRPSARTAPVG